MSQNVFNGYNYQDYQYQEQSTIIQQNYSEDSEQNDQFSLNWINLENIGDL